MTAIKRLSVCLAGFIAVSALGASYDFTAGTSSTNGWLSYTPLAPYGTVFTLSDGPGGYELSSGVSTAPALIGPARIGSTLPLTVNNFSITFDVLNYTTANHEFFGGAARLSNLGLGQTDGYAMGYDTSGELLISKITNESSQGPISASAAAPVALTAGNSYQFTFTGIGSSFNGAVYNLGSSTPLATVSGTDSTYASGTVGLLVASDTSSGIADTTFGSFSVIPEPTALTLLALGGLVVCGARRWRQARG